MQRGSFSGICAGLALVFGASMFAEGQEPPGGRGGAQPIPQFNRTPPVDAAAHERGRSLWASHCVDCHGAQARGTEKGPNIIRTKTVNFDQSSPQAGSVLGPFLKAGHPTQSGKPASFTNDEVIALATFLRQRVTDTMRWSTLFVPGNILVGDSRAGEAYFNGEGGCNTCHNATTRTLQGIASRLDTPVDLQQRMLFPGPGRGGRGAGAAGGNTSNRTTVTITPPSGPAVSGVLVEESEFYITLRDADGTIRAVRRTPGMRVAKNNPLQGHIDLLDRITDKQIHDLVAYLETLK
jgi:cytochrome c oxidase cbb3-type subunit III